ncbi:hypothetical protein SAMN05446934_0286 [Paraburkholderia hospita]|nr:hypothetical protein SAMN05446934_0286 [Paraburkholderia hospita]
MVLAGGGVTAPSRAQRIRIAIGEKLQVILRLAVGATSSVCRVIFVFFAAGSISDQIVGQKLSIMQCRVRSLQLDLCGGDAFRRGINVSHQFEDDGFAILESLV